MAKAIGRGAYRRKRDADSDWHGICRHTGGQHSGGGSSRTAYQYIKQRTAPWPIGVNAINVAVTKNVAKMAASA